METSGWMTGFMLEGIYTAAGDLDLSYAAAAAASAGSVGTEAAWPAVLAAADYAHETL
eukprot:SAG11_NODE_23640_length_385_cov_0.723776_1_plen_57_part_01